MVNKIIKTHQSLQTTIHVTEVNRIMKSYDVIRLRVILSIGICILNSLHLLIDLNLIPWVDHRDTLSRVWASMRAFKFIVHRRPSFVYRKEHEPKLVRDLNYLGSELNVISCTFSLEKEFEGCSIIYLARDWSTFMYESVPLLHPYLRYQEILL